MNKRQFEKVERRPISKADLEDAMRQVLLAPRGTTKSENRTPTEAELNQKWRLDRK